MSWSDGLLGRHAARGHPRRSDQIAVVQPQTPQPNEEEDVCHQGAQKKDVDVGIHVLEFLGGGQEVAAVGVIFRHQRSVGIVAEVIG